jgi:L-asparaginase
MEMNKLRIAHMSGPTATIQNSPPLVTSNKARARHGLPLRTTKDGEAPKYDALRPQKLAAPAKVFVEQFSAHPLERDAAHLYGPPDGYLGEDGLVSKDRRNPNDRPVFEIELLPEDGYYPLPYMARQADGSAWEEECSAPDAPADRARQGFYPDGSRSFDEIDRLGVGQDGLAGKLSSEAAISFFRVLPPAGFTQGLSNEARNDEGEGDIAPELRGRHFFPYKPRHLSAAPPRPALAKVTNDVQQIMSSHNVDAGLWTQGSPNIEDVVYWLNLLIDTTKPIACNSAQRPHGEVSNDGPRNILDSITYLNSRVWADEQSRNRLGVLLIQDQQMFAAREAAKADARPGGYVATGGMGGIVGQITHLNRCIVKYAPDYKHTHRSDVRITQLPGWVEASVSREGKLLRERIPILDADGRVLESAIPSVSIVKDGGFCGLDWDQDPEAEVDLVALIGHKLSMQRLGGLVVEGTTPSGNMTSPARMRLIQRAAFSGLPVVRVARGSHEGFADPHPVIIGGSNLTSTKARLLLMACLMKFGGLPTASNPDAPTQSERAQLTKAIQAYQDVFDNH